MCHLGLTTEDCVTSSSTMKKILNFFLLFAMNQRQTKRLKLEARLSAHKESRGIYYLPEIKNSRQKAP